MAFQDIWLTAGRYRLKCQIDFGSKRIWISTPYSTELIAEIRSMKGAKWHGYEDPPKKFWSVENCERNRFTLSYLMGQNPYAIYEQPLVEYQSKRPLREHQVEMVRQALTYKKVLWAAEMGLGKSLCAIEVIEAIGLENGFIDCWYVGPRAGVMAVNRELRKWKSSVIPRMMTYEELTKTMKNCTEKDRAPRAVIFDESSKLKTSTAQRSQAAALLVENMLDEHGEKAYVILLSGTPAPKNPTDFWHQVELCRPGFLKEGDPNKLKKRLALIEERESLSGGVYPHLITWLDDSKKCAVCGQYAEHENHRNTDALGQLNEKYHQWRESVNEVEKLYRRMKGPVLVKLKKHCLDLPEKQYEVINLMPTPEMVRTAKAIKASARRAIDALTLLRELSDGFQYSMQETDILIDCKGCHGTGVENLPEPHPCPMCDGTGSVLREERIAIDVGTPKDQCFLDILDEHEDIGRLIAWGGFTGTVDRLVKLAKEAGWSILRVDGRGYYACDHEGNTLDADVLLGAMDRSDPKFEELRETYPRICFVGHPQAGGMALTLTASPTEVFYSNCYNGEARMQAEDRFHRIGMDENRGARIIDLCCLKIDEVVLNNLKLKKRLQDISLGEIPDE